MLEEILNIRTKAVNQCSENIASFEDGFIFNTAFIVYSIAIFERSVLAIFTVDPHRDPHAEKSGRKQWTGKGQRLRPSATKMPRKC